MRKNELRRFANNQLNNDNHGSHRDRQYRRFVIQKVIDDLFKLKQCPAIWHGLTQAHLLALVSHWKKQKIKPATMMKYMTVIRYFLRHIPHQIEGIDNQALGIARIKSQVKNQLKLRNGLVKPNHPIALLVFDLQSAFGLTFGESIRLVPDIHVREHSIWVTREIAFNSQDRVIPVRHEDQRIILQSLHAFTTNHHSLISALGYHAVRQTYHASMQCAGLHPAQSYRYKYAKQQFSSLLQTLSHREASAILMREMGLKSRTTLWGYLHE